MGTIVVSNVSKAYKRYSTKWARIVEWLTGRQAHEQTWILRNISFKVEPGEAVGIVGVNGAGKSTLLKIITGTTQPTTGSIHISGKVAALLELGMGFHPDFTGRQNAYMAGQLLGYSADEICSFMPEIEAFADIGDYIDRPLRIYSSGMQVRLAFAVSTAVRPDILIVDEALSVGDAAFQRKCHRRIEEYRSEGTTLLFVSHDTSSIKKICKSAIYLKSGEICMYGNAKDVCDRYEKNLFGFDDFIEAKIDEKQPRSIGAFFDENLSATSLEKSFGGLEASIKNVSISTRLNQTVNVIDEMEGFVISYEVQSSSLLKEVHFGIMIRTVEGVNVYGTNSDQDGPGLDLVPGEKVKATFSIVNNLLPGTYYLTCGISHLKEDGRNFLHRRIDCLVFRVTEVFPRRATTGLANLAANFKVNYF